MLLLFLLGLKKKQIQTLSKTILFSINEKQVIFLIFTFRIVLNFYIFQYKIYYLNGYLNKVKGIRMPKKTYYSKNYRIGNDPQEKETNTWDEVGDPFD